jgi:hypothetical protein
MLIEITHCILIFTTKNMIRSGLEYSLSREVYTGRMMIFNFVGLQVCVHSTLSVFNCVGLQACVPSTLSDFNYVCLQLRRLQLRRVNSVGFNSVVYNFVTDPYHRIILHLLIELTSHIWQYIHPQNNMDHATNYLKI